jgi:hypothetical protein
MVAVASILHEENEAYMPQWRGSVKGELPIRTATERTSMCRLLPSENDVVPKLFLASFSDAKEVIWANY